MSSAVHRHPGSVVAIAGLLALAGPSGAQDRAPLDPGVSDINSLQTSLRTLPPVVRHDTAFEHVYQSPLDPNQRYRVAGGLYAVFDASEYVAVPGGAVPVYPAGVRFSIGKPLGFGDGPVDPATEALLRYTNPRFDLRAMDRDRGEGRADRTTSVVRMPTPVQTISSEGVRQQRLREITAKALRKAGPGG
jgi:hypothetical protein